MNVLHQSALYLHVLIGAAALIVFWLPVIARKGSAWHKRAGRWFANGMYAVALSGVLMSTLSLWNPLGVHFAGQALSPEQAVAVAAQVRIFSVFLLMLSVLVFASVYHAVLVLRARSDRRLLRRPLHLGALTALAVLAPVVGMIGVRSGETLLIIFFVVGTLSAAGMLRYTFKATISHNEWWIAHLGGMIGAGIAAYTAFFAFGGRALFAEILSGQWQIVPWVLPGIVGTAFITQQSRHYRRKFASRGAVAQPSPPGTD